MNMQWQYPARCSRGCWGHLHGVVVHLEEGAREIHPGLHKGPLTLSAVFDLCPLLWQLRLHSLQVV